MTWSLFAPPLWFPLTPPLTPALHAGMITIPPSTPRPWRALAIEQHAALLSREIEIEKLKLLVLKRIQFGRKSEKVDRQETGAWHASELTFCFDRTKRCEQAAGNTPEAQALAK
jgi:hypothetical protein